MMTVQQSGVCTRCIASIAVVVRITELRDYYLYLRSPWLAKLSVLRDTATIAASVALGRM